MKGQPSSYDDEFDCVPCSEGCDECTDGSPCVYHVNVTPRIILITIDALAAVLALVIGVVVFAFRESKVLYLLFVDKIKTLVSGPLSYQLDTFR